MTYVTDPETNKALVEEMNNKLNNKTKPVGLDSPEVKALLKEIKDKLNSRQESNRRTIKGSPADKYFKSRRIELEKEIDKLEFWGKGNYKKLFEQSLAQRNLWECKAQLAELNKAELAVKTAIDRVKYKIDELFEDVCDKETITGTFEEELKQELGITNK